MASKNDKKMTKSYFDVLGICCTSEVPLIENILKSLDGIKEYSVIVPSRTVIVVHDSLVISQFHIVSSDGSDSVDLLYLGSERWKFPSFTVVGFVSGSRGFLSSVPPAIDLVFRWSSNLGEGDEVYGELDSEDGFSSEYDEGASLDSGYWWADSILCWWRRHWRCSRIDRLMLSSAGNDEMGGSREDDGS